MQAIIECPNARQNRRPRVPELIRIRDALDVCAQKAEGFMDAMEVTGAVINQRNHAGSLAGYRPDFNLASPAQEEMARIELPG
jgi:hypothetical protein